MKIARYLAHGQISYGMVDGNTVKELSASPYEDYKVTDHSHPLDHVKLLPPSKPTKSLAIGLNYSSHRQDRQPPAEPMVFYKTPTSLIGPGETIIRPKGTAKLDAEGELVIIIKDRCRNVSKADAMKHVLGYTCGNDVSERTWQKNDSTFWRAKGSDTFAPVGPWIETDINPQELEILVRLNGEEVQRAYTKDMLFTFSEIVSYLSQQVTLHPGDLVFSVLYHMV